MTEYDEIRKTLCRWYDGETTSFEQRRLVDFFSEERELPPDLNRERELFRSLSVDDVETEIPEEFAARISAAIDTEMARERKTVPPALKLRRRIVAACGIAACLIVAVMSYFIASYQVGRQIPHPRMTLNEPELMESSSTDAVPGIIHENLCAASVESQLAVNKTPRRHASSKVKDKMQTVDPNMDNNGNTEPYAQDTYLSEDEEELLISHNYIVVRDEREANAILNTVFEQFETCMEEQSLQIQDISQEYETRVRQVCY